MFQRGTQSTAIHIIKLARPMLCIIDEGFEEESIMENTQNTQHCILIAPVRDRAGRIRFQEEPRVLREINNLDRRMFLVQFEDGATTFLFPNEVTLCQAVAIRPPILQR